MAKLRSGILGNTRGKVAGVVGSQWKDKNYIREYVKPANPNTTAQQAQRTALSLGVSIAKPIVGPVLNQFISPYEKAMSGFNRFIKANMEIFQAASPSFENMKLSFGNLWPAQVSSATLDATPEVTINFNTDNGTNGSSDDRVIGLVFDDSSKRWFFSDTPAQRSDGSVVVPVIDDVSESDISYFTVAFVDPPENIEEISASSGGHI